MTASRSALKRVDKHAIQPHEFEDAQELTDDQLAGNETLRRATKRAMARVRT
jgi:hypothetical protein